VQRGEVRGHAALTPREFDIMMRLVAGESTGKIAAQLNRSPKTISTHRSRLFEKLNVQSNAQLTRYAMEHGLIGPTLTSE
jgi:DNA-binding CsgD family transcriptional regulator